MFHKLLSKLKKRLSLFDLVIVLIILILGLSFFFFFYRKGEYITIRVKVTDQDVLYHQRTEPLIWYANRFEIGDAELDALGRKITEIVGIERFNISADKQAVYLDLRVKGVYDSRTKLYSARGKALLFGTPLRFYLSKVTFDGFVTEFPGSSFQRNLRTGSAVVTLLGRNVEPAIVYTLKVGDTIYDSNQSLLTEVKSVDVTPAEKVTSNNSGNLLLRYDPLYKDMKLTVMVKIKEINGEVYAFDNLPLKVGEVLPLNFPNISIYPMIAVVNETLFLK